MKVHHNVDINSQPTFSSIFLGEVNYMSEYTYLQANTNELCATSNFKWKDNAPVYLVIASEFSTVDNKLLGF